MTAAISAAALLGAPLSGDFALVSLSDLMTPWERIERRLEAVGAGDFACALNNPASRQRAGHLRRACEVLLRYRAPETVCGLARNVAREGQARRILTLRELAEERLDMFTTVLVGSSETILRHGRMLTPRGYGR